MDFFPSALSYLFQDESSKFTNDPDDPGGPTKWGVTQKVFENFCLQKLTLEQMQNLTVDDVSPVYRLRYWSPLSCGEMMDPGIAIAIFDTAVLYGIYPTGHMAQTALSLNGFDVQIDSVIGPVTLGLLNSVSRAQFLQRFVECIFHRIEVLVEGNPEFGKYRQGWENRANRLLTLNASHAFNIST